MTLRAPLLTSGRAPGVGSARSDTKVGPVTLLVLVPIMASVGQDTVFQVLSPTMGALPSVGRAPSLRPTTLKRSWDAVGG